MVYIDIPFYLGEKKTRSTTISILFSREQYIVHVVKLKRNGFMKEGKKYE